MKALKNKKWLWIGGGVLLVILIVGGTLLLRGGATQAQQPQEGEIVTAFVGDLSGSATASGQLEAQREARLSLDISGKVAEVIVEEGTAVSAGDPLLRLDTAELERAVANAEQALLAQEANLARLVAPPSAADLAAAEAGVASAQAQLDALRDSPTDDNVAASEANLRAAQANVWAASEQLAQAQQGAGEAEIAAAQADFIAAQGNQEATQELYDRLIECFDFTLPDGEERTICPGLGNPEEQTRYNLQVANANLEAAQATLNNLLAGPDPNAVAVAQASLASATARRDAAQANHDLLLQGPSEAQIAGAEASLAQAEANLDALVGGPTESQTATAAAQVEQARITLQRAQRNLEKATLRAPFDGVVTAVTVSEGEQAGGIVAEMVDIGSLEVVLEVDEVDIGEIVPGQPATITLETWPDDELAGQVTAAAPAATVSNSALVTYAVNLSLGETNLPVRVGMTANAELITAQRDGVLLVPNAAINADRAAGTYSVNLVGTGPDGSQTITETAVTIGLRDGQYTQITSGVQEGDRLLVGSATPRRQFGPGGGDGPPFGN